MAKNTDFMSEVRDWCQNRVKADDTHVLRSEDSDGTPVMECVISQDRQRVHIEFDGNKNGKVLYNDEDRQSSTRTGYEQDWEGHIENVDLHEDGVTMAGKQATFSINWD